MTHRESFECGRAGEDGTLFILHFCKTQQLKDLFGATFAVRCVNINVCKVFLGRVHLLAYASCIVLKAISVCSSPGLNSSPDVLFTSTDRPV